MSGIANSTVRRMTNISNYTCLSTDSKPTLAAANTGSSILETDTGRRYVWEGTEWVLDSNNYTTGPDTLTATGTGEVCNVTGFTLATYLYTISNINTSVTVQMEGKAGASAWTIIGAAETKTANGNYGLASTQVSHYDSLRFNFSAEAGGTDAQIIETGVFGGDWR